MFGICFCYDRNYITGNAPRGIYVISSTEVYETLVDELREKLKTRQEDAEFEFGWDREYRLCILEFSEQNIIKELKLVDQADGFWLEQVQNTTEIQPYEPSPAG
jgi:hypothetical protein